MVIEIDTKNIKKISFGIMNNYIDVTELITNKLNSNEKIKLSIDIFPSDPYVGEKKRLIIYYESGFNVIVNENDIIIKKKYIIPKPNNNIITLNNINTSYDYIVSTNARDEPNIVEWIIYHLMIGFDYVVIIDHKSLIPIQNLIQNFEWKNKVFVIRREDKGAVKLLFLNKIIVPFMMRKCNKYFIHLDADEYLYINENQSLQTFTESLKADIIAINWVMFGSNNMEKNPDKYKCLIPTFTKSEKILNQHFKLLIKIDKSVQFEFNSPHSIKYITRKKLIYTNVLGQVMNGNDVYQLMKNSLKISPFDTPVYINHYFVQSKEDYIKRKVNRERDDINVKRPFDVKILELSNDIDNFNIYNYSKIIIKQLEENEKNILERKQIENNSFGFILLRYVKCDKTNESWIRCYESIRRFYDNLIIIIDDNSNVNYITEYPVTNCIVINSEFPRRGELLPYYYYIKNKFFDRAIIIHDSMELTKFYNFKNIKNFKNYSRIFCFPSPAYNLDVEYFQEMSKYVTNGNKLYQYHLLYRNSLFGCFGVCYVIDYDYLVDINNKYNIVNLINYIDTRKKRQCLERFLSCLFEYDRGKRFITRRDLFGSIFDNKGEYIKKYFFGR